MITVIRLTNLACNLINKDLLKNRLNLVKLPVEKLNKLLIQLYESGILEVKSLNEDKNIAKLYEFGFVDYLVIDETDLKNEAERIKNKHRHFSIKHVEAINIELTYECNSHCSHCILQNFRENLKNIELSFNEIKQIIADAYFAGLIQNGINFTGGEALLAKADIFELIGYASSYGIPTRLFTNSFWGNRLFFKAGNHRFPTALTLVKKLKKSGLNHLSLSFNSRIDKEKTGVKQLTSIIHACETIGLHYEIVSSPILKKQFDSFINYIYKVLNVKKLKYMSPVKMDLVDIGGASKFCFENIEKLSLQELVNKSLCKGKGFYMPAMLTIAPNGDIRSCMYAIGLNNLGNIYQKNLFSIINDFNDKVSSNFANNQAVKLSEILYEPYKNIYKQFSHPCSANVLLARLIQEYYKLKENGEPDSKQLLEINKKVAFELNLLKED